jgi:hypothetical protein
MGSEVAEAKDGVFDRFSIVGATAALNDKTEGAIELERRLVRGAHFEPAARGARAAALRQRLLDESATESVSSLARSHRQIQDFHFIGHHPRQQKTSRPFFGFCRYKQDRTFSREEVCVAVG